MVLVIDIGNTNITCGIFEGDEIKTTFRLTTKLQRTSDEYGVFICELLRTNHIEIEDIEAVLISSVVPNINYSFQNGIIKYIGKKPLLVGAGTKTGIKIQIANPKEAGPDRIVDAVGAYYLYGGPILVIDFGTATTYDLITEDGAFTAGVTSPGIRISANALWHDTASLPEIEIKKPSSILAKDTITSMQAGLVYGYMGQTEYIIRKMKEESGLSNLKVVATGGLGKMISEEVEEIDIYDPMLTLKGLNIIYKKNK
ncbi:MAG: type III pantothenate kinase [bacterium]|nr:type III pantothenate kinase [bacterium]